MTGPSPFAGAVRAGPGRAYWGWPMNASALSNCPSPPGTFPWTVSSAISRLFCCDRHDHGRVWGTLEIALGVPRRHDAQGEYKHENLNQIRLTAHYLPSNTGLQPGCSVRAPATR